MLENKNNTLDFTISAARKSIKNRFPELNDTDIQSVIEESIESYKKYKNQHPDLKIKVSIFLIFYATIKIENNLSEQDLELILKENEKIFIVGGKKQKESLRKIEKKTNNQNKQTFNLIKKKLSSYIDINENLIRKNITILVNNYPNLSFSNIATLITNIMDEKIIRQYKEYNIIEYCEKFGIDFFKVLDSYITLLYNNSKKSKNSILLDSINNVIINDVKDSEIQTVSKYDLIKELGANNAFYNKYSLLSQNFSSVPKNIILYSTCDYYYIKKHDNKLLKLISNEKRKGSSIDSLILEIALLRMEQVLTYEEAYYMAFKNFEEGTSLLHSKYGDSAEEKTQNIYSKK